MFNCGQDEETFWKKMNPRRLHMLFNAHFRPNRKPQEELPAPGGNRVRYVDFDIPAGNTMSLAEYMTRGG